MSVLFNHARRYELFDDNPIHLVRQSAKRRTVPHILLVDEIRQLLDAVGPLPRILIFNGRNHGSSSERTVRPAMERPGLRQWRNQRGAIGRPWCHQQLQDGVLHEARPDGTLPG